MSSNFALTLGYLNPASNNPAQDSIAIMLNFNSSEVGLIEGTDDTDSSMESLFNIRAEKNLYRLNFFMGEGRVKEEMAKRRNGEMIKII